MVPLALKTDDPSSFTANFRDVDLGSVALQNLRFSSLHASRTPALIRRSDPEACVMVHVVRGSLGVRQLGSETVVSEGDLALYESSHPFLFQEWDAQGPTEVFFLQVPKRILPAPAERLKSLLATRLSGGNGIGALTAQTLSAASRQLPHCTPTDVARLGVILAELLAALIGHHLDVESARPHESHSGIALLAIEKFVAQHLGDPQLGPGMIASAHHISVRHLHHLFERRDTTVAAYIRGQRLEMVRRDLADPASRAVPINSVARRWGFLDQATLSRAFRRAYGQTPRDYRKSVQHPHSVRT